MKHIRSFIFIILMGLIAFVQACGGNSAGSSLPQIDSIIDGWNVAIETDGQIGINPSTFTITFDEAVDESLFTIENVTLTCGDLAAASLSFSLDETQKILTVTVANAYKYQLLECALTIDETIAVVDNHTFTNAAAVSDDFNIDSSAHWTLIADEDFYTSWSEMISDGFATFDTANSSLDISFEDQSDKEVIIYKEVTVTSDHSIELYIPSMADLVDEDSHLLVSLTDTLDAKEASKGYYLSVNGENLGGGIGTCFFRAVTTSPSFSAGYNAACLISSGGFYVRFIKSGDDFSIQYKADGESNYSDMTHTEGSEMSDIGIEGSYYLDLSFQSSEYGGDEQISLGYISVNGITVDGMY
jgi:hypothetical protein